MSEQKQIEHESLIQPKGGAALSTDTTSHSGVALLVLPLGDLNKAGHVGNTVLLDLINEARMRFLEHAVPALQGDADITLGHSRSGVRKVVAQQTIEYLRELPYSQEPVTAKLWVTYLGTSSFCLATALSDGSKNPVARAEATYVLLQGPKNHPWPMSGEVRELLSRHSGDPLQFRPRPSLR